MDVLRPGAPLRAELMPRPGSLEVVLSHDTQGVVLELAGELDLATAPRLERTLHELGSTNPGRILIDLRGLGFMDCTGIAVMVRGQESARTGGYRFALRPGPRQVQRLFALTGLLYRFTFEDESP